MRTVYDLNLGDLHKSLVENYKIKYFKYESSNKKPIFLYIQTEDQTMVKLCLDFYNDIELSVLIMYIRDIGDLDVYKSILKDIEEIIEDIEQHLVERGCVIV